MSVEDVREIHNKKMALREEMIALIIQLSTEGKMEWDFSHFDDSVYGQTARAEYKGITFVSNHWQDGLEFIVVEKKKEKMRIIDDFKGRQAMRLREFLGVLASEDPTLQQIRREEKARLKRSEEEGRKRLEENTEKIGEIVQLFQAQN